jgi:hypothetical protein
MAIADEILKRIQIEIETDPQKIGYAGKTDEEIAALLSSTVYKEKTVIESSAPPLSRILDNIAYFPNLVTKDEIAIARTKI